MIYQFVSLITREPDYNKSNFLEELKEKTGEIRSWIKLKASQLNGALTRGKSTVEDVFQANRNDTFKMGAAKRSKSLYNLKKSVFIYNPDLESCDPFQREDFPVQKSTKIPG